MNNEEQVFQQALADDPNDAVTRLVYADWLGEHGHTEPARRLRWWGHVLPHVPEPHHGPTRSLKGVTLPDWAIKLALNHHARGFSGGPLHVADELHIIGRVPRNDPDKPPPGSHSRFPNASADWWYEIMRAVPTGVWHRGNHAHEVQEAARRAGQPTQLARITAPGSADDQQSVTVKVPVPTPVNNPKPRPQPTEHTPVFFLPG